MDETTGPRCPTCDDVLTEIDLDVDVRHSRRYDGDYDPSTGYYRLGYRQDFSDGELYLDTAVAHCRGCGHDLSIASIEDDRGADEITVGLVGDLA